MRYAPSWVKSGAWIAEISLFDEDVEIPWTITVGLDGRRYSAKVSIDCPDDVPIKFKKL